MNIHLPAEAKPRYNSEYPNIYEVSPRDATRRGHGRPVGGGQPCTIVLPLIRIRKPIFSAPRLMNSAATLQRRVKATGMTSPMNWRCDHE